MSVSFSSVSCRPMHCAGCALDADGNSFLLRDEVAAFLKRGALERAKTVQRLASHKSVGFDQMDGYDDNPLGRARAGEHPPTAQMRQELRAAGVPLPGEDELRRLSAIFNDRLRRLMEKENRDRKNTGWYTLFQEVEAAARVRASLLSAHTHALSAHTHDASAKGLVVPPPPECR
jgi:hypothetical protein